jgi:hypothetical protein
MNEQEVITLYHLAKWVKDWQNTCELNYVDPSKVEVFIENNRKKYRPFSGSLGFGSKGVSVSIEYFDSDIVRFDPKDERPPVGEYWNSRGASSFDVSGFISSKPAGERLLRMVKYILETDEPKTRLDYREHEPNWIQFKFSAEEFDVEKLDELARANGNVITEQIVRMCVKERKQED